MEKIRHYFPAQGETVVSWLCPSGQFGAYLEGENEHLRGYGATRLSAIADLNRLLEECAEWEDDEIQQAAE